MANSLMNVAVNSAMQRSGKRTRVRSANLSDNERVASVVGGACLALWGLGSRGATAKVALPALGSALIYRGLSGWCAMYDMLGIRGDRPDGPNAAVRAGAGVKVEAAVVVNRPARELYDHWRQFDRLPQFMRHLDSVTVNGDKSHWVVTGPLGLRVEWDAEIYNEKSGEMIAWRSLPGADVDTAGSVHFRQIPGGRGTELTVSLKYDPPAGKVGDWLASLFGESPSQQIREDLRRFKEMMEAKQTVAARGQTAAP